MEILGVILVEEIAWPTDFLCGENGLDTISYVELLHQDRHVMFDRFFAYVETSGYFTICLPSHEVGDNLFFANA
ncbi:hypothetical protein D3C86_1558780 [compost metagenome]